MTQHTELIERLRRRAWLARSGTTTDIHLIEDEAINALEAQAREIAELKAQLAATAKNAFEAMPHDIPQRMKDAICEETGWSGSMVSRMYTELRKAFTGEPYKANEDLDAALLEIARLRKDADTAAERLQWLATCSDYEMGDGDAARDVACELIALLGGTKPRGF